MILPDFRPITGYVVADYMGKGAREAVNGSPPMDDKPTEQCRPPSTVERFPFDVDERSSE